MASLLLPLKATIFFAFNHFSESLCTYLFKAFLKSIPKGLKGMFVAQAAL